jgi:lysophospholipase L1-like esterase
MGGAGSINNWASQGLAQGDRVHLSSAGYTRMGSMFYEDIIDAFKKYQARPQRNNNNRPNRGRGQ